MRNCKWCGKEFDPGHYPNGKPRRTKLCPECQLEIVTPKPRYCKGCGKEFVVQGKARYKRAYCDECLEKYKTRRVKKMARTDDYGIYLALFLLGGLESRRILILELPEHGEDFIAFGRKPMLDEFHKLLDKDKIKCRDIEMSRTVEREERELLEVIERIDKSFQETKEHLRQIGYTGKSWDDFVYNVLLQGKASEEDIKEFPHVVTSDSRVFGQCESCHKYVEEKKIGEGFDPTLHLCYDWENRRLLCPECFSRQVSLV